MQVRIKFKRKDGQLYGFKNDRTVAKAKVLIKEQLLDDVDITDIYLTYWGTWHEHFYKRIKKDGVFENLKWLGVKKKGN